jgi:hypothetical protein
MYTLTTATETVECKDLAHLAIEIGYAVSNGCNDFHVSTTEEETALLNERLQDVTA